MGGNLGRKGPTFDENGSTSQRSGSVFGRRSWLLVWECRSLTEDLPGMSRPMIQSLVWKTAVKADLITSRLPLTIENYRRSGVTILIAKGSST